MTIDLAPCARDRTLVRITQTPFELIDDPESPPPSAQELALPWRRILGRLVNLMEDEVDVDESEPDSE